MSKKFEPIPKFKNEDQERRFWAKADTAKYFDFSKAETVIFPNLKPTTRKISIRLPEWLIGSLKSLGNRRDVPYQTLMKMFLADRIKKELGETAIPK